MELVSAFHCSVSIIELSVKGDHLKISIRDVIMSIAFVYAFIHIRL